MITRFGKSSRAFPFWQSPSQPLPLSCSRLSEPASLSEGHYRTCFLSQQYVHPKGEFSHCTMGFASPLNCVFFKEKEQSDCPWTMLPPPCYQHTPSPHQVWQDPSSYKQKHQTSIKMSPKLASTLQEPIQHPRTVPPKITCSKWTSDREYFLCGHDFPTYFKPCPEHESLSIPLVGTYAPHFIDKVCPGWLCQRQEEENRKQFGNKAPERNFKKWRKE